MPNDNKSLKQVRQRSVNFSATIFLIPAILALIVFIAYPIIDSFALSTVKWNGISPNRVFVGLDNWTELVKDNFFWRAFRNNVIVMFFSLATQGVLAMVLATFLEITGRKGLVFKIVWFLPYLISSVTIGILFKFALDANFGIFASIAKLFGGGSVDRFN